MSREVKLRVKDGTLEAGTFTYILGPKDHTGQYTGFKDVNNKDIYEGDIVKDLTDYGDLYEQPGLYENNKVVCNLEVVFDATGCWCLSNKKLDHIDFLHSHDVEIIGNVHDNPELLG